MKLVPQTIVIWLITLGIIQAQTPSPQQTLSLPEAWQKAEKFNKTILEQDLRLKISHERLEQTKSERLPELGASTQYARVSNLPIYERGILNTPFQYPVLHNFFQLKTEAYFKVYEGKKLQTKIKAEETEHALVEEEKKQTESEVKLRIAAVYLDLQRNLIYKDLMLKNIEEAEKRLTEIRELNKNGVVLKSDLLRAELQLSRQKMTLHEIENSILITNQKLDLMIGLPDTTIVIPAPLPASDSLAKGYESFLDEAFDHAYQLKIASKQKEISELHLKEVRADYKPKVGLFAEYTYAYPQITFYPYAGALYGFGMAGLKASYSLSSLYHNKHREQAAMVEIQRQQVIESDREDQVRQAVKEAYVRYGEALHRIEVSELSTRQAAENYRIVHNTYFNQLSLLTDLLDADTQLLQSQYDLASARLAARLQYYQLLNTLGKL
ncbi:TolC family protein [Siphonobacter sp. SORGH_AS_0500]|uniref:TolC family protein n=1 Tax=Siphonobacter sp. SORGH_AS_0500 TaxID=1864824 RepID=UPI00285E349C|nr:TolC family protein [Siphonobacter sp. SORGH_AS_0500]MDR6194688.1 outer membrane protein [Siphonobacter sp. SORGH_AS_0500]